MFYADVNDISLPLTNAEQSQKAKRNENEISIRSFFIYFFAHYSFNIYLNLEIPFLLSTSIFPLHFFSRAASMFLLNLSCFRGSIDNMLLLSPECFILFITAHWYKNSIYSEFVSCNFFPWQRSEKRRVIAISHAGIVFAKTFCRFVGSNYLFSNISV